ncbi:MAG: hotdog fold thioesterase [Ardenticatenaceae bacterium]|nr:hotdog fold thioesterase [Ardenticatenaceae bacterium]
MAIWKNKLSVSELETVLHRNMAAVLDIHAAEVGDDYLVATMPVSDKTTMPLGYLHGGASCVLAESIGSVASVLCIDPTTHRVAGIEINASHMRGPREGLVKAICRPLRLGRTLHVWEIDIHDENGKIVCRSRLTVAIIPL